MFNDQTTLKCPAKEGLEDTLKRDLGTQLQPEVAPRGRKQEPHSKAKPRDPSEKNSGSHTFKVCGRFEAIKNKPVSSLCLTGRWLSTILTEPTVKTELLKKAGNRDI